MKLKNHTYTVPMEETFKLLEKRLLEANLNIDASSLKGALDNIKGTAITIGCGGSLVVADYLAKVLYNKGIFSVCKNARDIMHSDCNSDFLFAFSYSGKTHGIRLALDNFKGTKCLITCNSNLKDIPNTKTISFEHTDMDKEKSFISLSSTLIPVGEFLKYHENISKEKFSKKIIKYLKESQDWIKKLSNQDLFSYGSSEVFEIMTGYDTEVASLFLESTLIEAGLGNVIVHDKYDYCHGRSTINYQDNKNHNLIYLVNEKTEIDDFLLEILVIKYFPITIIDVSDSKTSFLERQYELLMKSIFFCKKVATDKKMDLSRVEYDPDLVKKVYSYKGEM